MVFGKMLRAFGASGVSIDTVLAQPAAQPGGQVQGEVLLRAGEGAAQIERITLGLVTRVESERGDHEYASGVEFHRFDVTGSFTLAAKEERSLPFQFVVPWETPVTEVYGQHLHGMTMGVRTEVAIAKAIDKGDLDPLAIQPLPAQLRILEAFDNLGFRFKGADLEAGQLAGVRQTLPFFQEIEFFPPRHASGINEVEVTFVADPHGVEVILEVDKRGGFFSGGGDTFRRLRVDHADTHTDWTAEIDGWIRHAAQHSTHHNSHGHPGYGHHGHGGHYGHSGGRGGGLGAGAVVGGVAAGLVGGYLAGEVMDEMFDEE